MYGRRKTPPSRQEQELGRGELRIADNKDRMDELHVYMPEEESKVKISFFLPSGEVSGGDRHILTERRG